MSRHRWGPSTKRYGVPSERTCQVCGIVKIQRHARNHHWVEWWHADRGFINTETTPPCDAHKGEP